MFSHIINWLFPPQCVHCGREGAWLCRSAQKDLEASPILMNPITIPGVDRVMCRADYDLPIIADIIQGLKYHYLTAQAEIFPDLLRPLIDQLDVPQGTVIVPIPLHRSRQMSRGFNQSELIAKALSKVTGFPVKNILQRHRATKAQATLKAKERLMNVVDAFQVRANVKTPTSVILVDDVITTGSTIRECAEVLREVGVQKITAVAFAKG